MSEHDGGVSPWAVDGDRAVNFVALGYVSAERACGGLARLMDIGRLVFHDEEGVVGQRAPGDLNGHRESDGVRSPFHVVDRPPSLGVVVLRGER